MALLLITKDNEINKTCTQKPYKITQNLPYLILREKSKPWFSRLLRHQPGNGVRLFWAVMLSLGLGLEFFCGLVNITDFRTHTQAYLLIYCRSFLQLSTQRSRDDDRCALLLSLLSDAERLTSYVNSLLYTYERQHRQTLHANDSVPTTSKNYATYCSIFIYEISKNNIAV